MTRTIPREVSEKDIGWLAGIIDGEGSVTFTVPRKTSSNKIIYGIHIVNTNKEMLEKCLWIIKSIAPTQTPLKLKPKIYKNGTIFKKEPLQCYQITIRRKDVIKIVIENIIDCLTEKRYKCLKLLNYLEKQPIGAKITNEQVKEYISFTPVETKRVTLQ